MKKQLLGFLILLLGNELHAQTCTSEKGFNDFPFTQNGLTVTASGTGSYTNYSSPYVNCGASTKANSLYIGGSGAATYTSTFSTGVNDMVYNITAANTGEIFTVTVNNGTPTLTMISGSCNSEWSISGNVLSVVGSSTAGTVLKVHSSQPYTSITFAHNGGGGGSLMTMCMDGVFNSISNPTVSSVSAPANGSYKAGQNLDFTVNFGTAITVDATGGTPTIPVTIGSTTYNATYVSGSGSTALVFRYTIAEGNNDANGIALGSAIALNGSTLKDGSATDATLTLANVAAMTSVLVDTDVPLVPSLGSLVDNSSIKNNKPVISGTAEAHSLVTIYKNGAPLTTVTADGSGNYTYTPTVAFADGDYSITTTAKDAAGNISAASTAIHITVDTAVPLAPVLVSPVANSNVPSLPTITGTAEANAKVTIYLDNTFLADVTADANGNFEYTSTTEFTQGNRKLRFTATDAAGNVSTTSASTTIIVDTVAPAAPVLAGPADNSIITKNRPTFKGTAEANSTVSIYLDGTLFKTVPADGSGNFSFIPEEGIEDGTYLISITATDAAGNVSEVGNKATILLDATPPTVPSAPLIASQDPAETGNDLPVITGTGEPGSTVTLYEGSVVIGSAVVDDNGKYNITPTSPLAIGNHGLKAVAKDPAGNLSKASSVGVIAVAPNKQPLINSIADVNLCNTQKPQVISLSGLTACETNQTLALSVSSDNNDLFSELSIVSTGETTAEIHYVLKAGVAGAAKITVTLKDNGGTLNGGVDIRDENFSIDVYPIVIASISSDLGLEIAKGNTATLTASGGTTYSWASADGIVSGSNSAILQVRPAETTTYTVTVTNANGCSATQQVTLVVKPDLAVIKASNIVTPNGDGVNDRFVIKNIDMYPNNTVRIFDRSGRELYSKENYADEWDGTLNGAPLAEGTYFYLIDFGGKAAAFKGYITIVSDNR